jgi:hypothetical protein
MTVIGRFIEWQTRDPGRPENSKQNKYQEIYTRAHCGQTADHDIQKKNLERSQRTKGKRFGKKKKKIGHDKTNQKNVKIAVLILGKRLQKKNYQGYYLMIKRSILQKHTTIFNVYISNNRTSKY